METRSYKIVHPKPPKRIPRAELFEQAENNSWGRIEVLFSANGEPDRVIVLLGSLGFMAVHYRVSLYELRPGRLFGKDRMVLRASRSFDDERAQAEGWFETVVSAYRKLHAAATPVAIQQN